MSQLVVRYFSPVATVCLVGLFAQLAMAQGPVRNFTQDIRAQRADYPGPIAYSPSDPDTRSKRFRMQTGHYGFFYNCDGEECKRNSPYICWNSQHGPDWRNGWKKALRLDRHDVKQRIYDGACLSGQCNQCESCSQNQAPMGYGQLNKKAAGIQVAKQAYQKQTYQKQVAATQQAEVAPARQRLPIINAMSLNRLTDPTAKPVAKPQATQKIKSAPKKRTARQQWLLDIR